MTTRISHFRVGLILLALLGTGCGTSTETISNPIPPSSAPVTARATPLSTSAPSTTPTRLAATSKTAVAPSPAIPSPTLKSGPALALWYLNAGQLYRYSLRDWTAEQLPLLANDTVHSAVLSRTGDRLVYSNDAGLGFTDLNSGDNLLLFRHVVTATEIVDHRYYEPLSWSSDAEWLWVGVQYGEGYRHLVASVVHNAPLYFNCYTEMEWFPDQAKFVALVSYSGLAGCGAQDGVYIVDLTGSQSVENWIYHESSLVQASERKWRYVALSPTGNDAAFVLRVALGSTAESRLLHITTIGEKLSDLAHSQGNLVTPLWSRTGKSLYFVEQIGMASTLFTIDVDTREKVSLYASQQSEYLLSLSPDGQWLVLGTQDTPRHWLSLRVLHISGRVTQAIKLDTSSPNPLVGWERIK